MKSKKYKPSKETLESIKRIDERIIKFYSEVEKWAFILLPVKTAIITMLQKRNFPNVVNVEKRITKVLIYQNGSSMIKTCKNILQIFNFYFFYDWTGN